MISAILEFGALVKKTANAFPSVWLRIEINNDYSATRAETDIVAVPVAPEKLRNRAIMWVVFPPFFHGGLLSGTFYFSQWSI